jgi:Cys-tRNA(Pro)/Cys-tRNA(Cys) deacylase
MRRQEQERTKVNTPCLSLLEQEGIAYRIHSYEHDRDTTSYGLEAAEKLAIEADRIFKTLVVQLDSGELVIGIIPVTMKLVMKSVAKVFHAKKAQMAPAPLVERTTGYVLGGVSPIGQKRLLPTIIDETAILFETILVSGGMRGLDVEIGTDLLKDLLKAEFESISV